MSTASNAYPSKCPPWNIQHERVKRFTRPIDLAWKNSSSMNNATVFHGKLFSLSLARRHADVPHCAMTTSYEQRMEGPTIACKRSRNVVGTYPSKWWVSDKISQENGLAGSNLPMSPMKCRGIDVTMLAGGKLHSKRELLFQPGNSAWSAEASRWCRS